jgi:hypothetical protein
MGKRKSAKRNEKASKLKDLKVKAKSVAAVKGGAVHGNEPGTLKRT